MGQVGAILDAVSTGATDSAGQQAHCNLVTSVFNNLWINFSSSIGVSRSVPGNGYTAYSFVSASIPFHVIVATFTGSATEPHSADGSWGLGWGFLNDYYTPNNGSAGPAYLPLRCFQTRSFPAGITQQNNNLSEIRGGAAGIYIVQNTGSTHPFDYNIYDIGKSGSFHQANAVYPIADKINGYFIDGVLPLTTISAVTRTMQYVMANRAGYPGNNFGITPYNTARCSLLADSDNVLLITGQSTTTTVSSYRAHYFGKLEQPTLWRPASSGTMQVPYVFLSCADMDYDPPIPQVSNIQFPDSTLVTYGNFQGTSIFQGGALHPTASFGLQSLHIDFQSGLYATDMSPNRNFSPPRYDQYPLHVWMTCSHTLSAGLIYLGQINSFLRLMAGAISHDTNTDLSRAVFGMAGGATRTYGFSGATKSAFRFSTFWTGSHGAPGTGASSSGSAYLINV